MITELEASLLEISTINIENMGKYLGRSDRTYFNDYMFICQHKNDFDNRLLVVNVYSGKYRLLRFSPLPTNLSAESNVQIFIPLHYANGQFLAYIFVGTKSGAWRSTLNSVKLDLNKEECRILEKIHQFWGDFFYEIETSANDPTFLIQKISCSHLYIVHRVFFDIEKLEIKVEKVAEFKDLAILASWTTYSDLLIARSVEPVGLYVRNLKTGESKKVEVQGLGQERLIGILQTRNDSTLRLIFNGHSTFSKTGIVDLYITAMECSEYKKIFILNDVYSPLVFNNNSKLQTLSDNKCDSQVHYQLIIGMPESLLVLTRIRLHRIIKNKQISLPESLSIYVDFKYAVAYSTFY